MSDKTPRLGTSVLGDAELLEKARHSENGRRFTLLYDHGWNSSVVRGVYEKPRHARVALVCHLVWWTRHDTRQARRLFTRSALCPDDRTRYQEYFTTLVQSALRLLGTECYEPNYTSTSPNGI
ncbi:phage NrS-1 polymerase family protein [Natrarchaeobius oligotrophus]|uniref:NrS-1 polymerase-like HBD domain-containing protein n=1 Tax=Natrarchaeobius chitinivorans TaxID=1679083 RepID=A0A3N6MGG4_NATCH|nr:hypothetical protein [Natrarchaeobius chitinivorans]RQH00085.1 hypothetical protein EA472_12820 [Natrarchaeobius chitinivorans]